MEIVNTKDSTDVVNGTVPETQDHVISNTGPLGDVIEAKEEDAFENNPELEQAAAVVGNESAVVDLAARAKSIEISQIDKDRFIDAVITGSRFTAYAYLYGGKVRVKFRSRTLAETEAIMAYIHRSGMSGKLITKADLSDGIMSALFVAQVAEVGDVAYPEMKTPYKYEETADGVKKPGWLDSLDMWKGKPEHLTAALGSALIDFEAKYWKMISESKNANFWNPGGSTGE